MPTRRAASAVFPPLHHPCRTHFVLGVANGPAGGTGAVRRRRSFWRKEGGVTASGGWGMRGQGGGYGDAARGGRSGVRRLEGGGRAGKGGGVV